ncbi:GAF domain-containing protein [Desulfobacca acetoxidans]
MNIEILLIASILFQLLAAVLALRLIRITGRARAWIIIAGALFLMIIRRVISLYELLTSGYLHPIDISAELVALVVSALFLLGISCIYPLFRTLQSSQEALRLNESRLAAVWELNQMTSAALQEVTDFALEAGVKLTRSQVGFVGMVDENEANLRILSWSRQVMDQCSVHSRPLLYPIATAGLWGEAVRRRRPLIVNDYEQSQEIKKGYPAGHISINRLLLVPVLDSGRVAALAAVGNKPEPYNEQDQRQLTLLLQGMWWHIQRQRSTQAMAHEIERMHQFQTKLIQTSNDGIIASDRQGNILIFNSGAETILGHRKEEVVGVIKVQELYSSGVARKILKELLSPRYGGRKRLVNYETVVLNKQGELIPVELSATLITDDHQVAAIVGFFRDLRERRLLQEKLLQNERLAILGRMAAHISHEIKNPLMVIGGFARQVRENLDGSPEKNLEKLQIIIDEIRRLEDFLLEVGRYGKFSEPHLVVGDLNVLIQEVCRFLDPILEEKRVRLKLDLDPKLPTFAFDPEHLRQVFLNLAKNSLEAMEHSGTLTFASRTVPGHILVEISDTGVGIPPEALAKIFQPFFSTKPRGSGLGLAISQQIMAAHQGEIQIASEPGRGTRVTLSFQVSF